MTKKSKILIIDDDPRMCESLKELLGREGYKIRTKNNGSAAIEVLTKESFDLVLTDIVLPDFEGYRIIDFLNAHNPEIPIIVMTGYPSIESAIKALQKGARDYLRKPIDTDELLMRIRNALEHKKLKKDHKQAVEKIEQQNVFLKTIIESLQHPFCVLDADNYQILMANSITYQGETVTTPKCFASDNPKSASEGNGNVLSLLEQVKKKKKPVKVEHAHQDNDENMRFFEVHGFPIIDDNGNVIQIIEYDIDITDRKRADETLADAKEELNSILKSVPDVIYRLDSDGNISFITDSIGQYGYSPEELLGTNVMDIICPEDREDAVYRINERRTGDMILEIGADMLEKVGYEVLTAQSGKEAIDVYKKNRERIGLVVLDMIIPGMNGGETYDRLRKLNPDIKVLLSSGYSIDGEATKILERGCNGFIQKPFSIKQLSLKISEILDT